MVISQVCLFLKLWPNDLSRLQILFYTLLQHISNILSVHHSLNMHAFQLIQLLADKIFLILHCIDVRLAEIGSSYYDGAE